MLLLTRWELLHEFSAMQDRPNHMNRLFRGTYSPEVPEEALATTSCTACGRPASDQRNGEPAYACDEMPKLCREREA
jgi:hypothetical protein